MPRLSRPGFALPVALAVMVVIGLLVAGAYFSTGQSTRAARDLSSTEQAFRVAEQGLARHTANWDTTFADTATVGTTSQPYVYDAQLRAGSNQVRVTKLTATSFLVTSTATFGSGAQQSRATVAQLYKVTVPRFNFLAALTSNGPIKIGGSSLIKGYDTSPTSWPCPPTEAPMPGIAVGPNDPVSFSGCNNLSCVDGQPDTVRSTAANDTTKYFVFGDMTWAELTRLATKKYPAGSTSPGIAPVPNTLSAQPCSYPDTPTNWNWGDVRRDAAYPCKDYFPIIYFQGTGATVRLTKGNGQGIMLVDGDLEISGGFEFFGPVIVRGHLTTTGTGGHLNGGVMAANVDLEQSSVLGDAVISYSTCAIKTAIDKALTSRIEPVVERSWVEQY